MAISVLPAQSTAFIVVCKKAFKRLRDENDELPIDNLGALRQGFEAMLREDSGDIPRSNDLWAKAIGLLQRKEENETSAAAQGTLSMEDDYNMEATAFGL